jgi:hypothetical protein
VQHTVVGPDGVADPVGETALAAHEPPVAVIVTSPSTPDGVPAPRPPEMAAHDVPLKLEELPFALPAQVVDP